jgi:hypothetical protein
VPLIFHFIKKLIDQCILYNAWKKTPFLDVVFGLCAYKDGLKVAWGIVLNIHASATMSFLLSYYIPFFIIIVYQGC